MSPAFLVACFDALRLARFNTTTKSEPGFFTGMPIPATGIFVATFPLILWQNPLGIALHLYNPWLLYATIAVLCWLMVSRIAFFRFLPSTFRLSAIWPQLLIVITGLALLPVLQTGAIATAFILYILLAFVYKPKQI